MTREEFNTAVMQDYKEFETKELTKTPQQIYCDSYEISKRRDWDNISQMIDDYINEELS